MKALTAACLILLAATAAAEIGAAMIVSIAVGARTGIEHGATPAPGAAEAAVRRILACHSDDHAPLV